MEKHKYETQRFLLKVGMELCWILSDFWSSERAFTFGSLCT